MKAQLKNDLRTMFNKHDPIRIYVDKDTNFDEYDPEIGGLLVRYQRSENLEQFTNELHSLFQKMFGKDIAGPKPRYKKLAKEVFLLLNQQK